MQIYRNLESEFFMVHLISTIAQRLMYIYFQILFYAYTNTHRCCIYVYIQMA